MSLAGLALPLSLPDEGRYAGIARDMLVHGDWWVPRLDGLPFFHKPPLFYWLDALTMRLFGIGPATARSAIVTTSSNRRRPLG